jgi:hypothetical protein
MLPGFQKRTWRHDVAADGIAVFEQINTGLGGGNEPVIGRALHSPRCDGKAVDQRKFFSVAHLLRALASARLALGKNFRLANIPRGGKL